jgi:hypothetical protein
MEKGLYCRSSIEQFSVANDDGMWPISISQILASGEIEKQYVTASESRVYCTPLKLDTSFR